MKTYETLRKYIKEYIPASGKNPVAFLSEATGYDDKQIKRIFCSDAYKNKSPSIKICFIFMTALKMDPFDALTFFNEMGVDYDELKAKKHFSLIKNKTFRDLIVDNYLKNSNNISPKDFFKGI